jgi:hypothetical protein
MEKSSHSEKLHEQIAYLEQKQHSELLLLKKQLRKTGQSLKPSNLIKSAIQDVASNTQLRATIKKAVIGLAVGLMTKKLLTSNKNKAPGHLGKTLLRSGLNLLFSNRYAILKSAGALAISALAARRDKNKLKRVTEPKEGIEPKEIELTESPGSAYAYTIPE